MLHCTPKTITEKKAPSELSGHDLKIMFKLFAEYYHNAKQELFKRDLAVKHTVILVRDKTSHIIKGFSSLSNDIIVVENKRVLCVFSGDTIIDKEYRGEEELQREWWKYVKSLNAEGIYRVYWIMISKGYRTYRLLPRYFKQFYPAPGAVIPEFEKKIVDAYLSRKYPQEYDSHSGLVMNTSQKDFLKDNDAHIPKRLLGDRNITYFAQRNPNYIKGDELACIAELSTNNLKPLARLYLADDSILRFLVRSLTCLKNALSS